MKLVKCDHPNVPVLNELWVLKFIDHKDMTFETREALETYINHEYSEGYGFMEYEKVPESVEHIVYYDVKPD